MSVGIKSVAFAVPSLVRTNAYWHEHHPELIAKAEQNALAKVWTRREADTPNLFDEVMEPYLSDPFVELSNGESSPTTRAA